MKALLVKRILNISSATKLLKQLNLYAYSLQRLMHIEKTWVKLNIYVFWQKMIW